MNSRAMRFMMSSKSIKKQKFQLKKIERLIYIRNVNRMFNKEELIENTVEVNIHYQGHRERMKIDIIREQKL